MEHLSKILAPIDFSPASGEAGRYAAEIAQDLQADLTLLHVMPPIAFDFALTSPSSERYAEIATHRHQALRHAFELFPPGQAETVLAARREIVEGDDPAEEIIRRVHDDHYGLIVMPTRGGGPLRRWLRIGSVTANVLQGAECPVLTGTRFGDHSPRLVRHILGAVDLGPQTSHVMRWSAGLARRYGAPLTFVHAMPGPGAANEDFFDPTWRTTLRTHLHEKVTALARECQAEGSIVIEPGDPHKVVSSLAERLKASVVVIGRGVSSDLIGRLRAQAGEIIRRAPCPVLSV